MDYRKMILTLINCVNKRDMSDFINSYSCEERISLIIDAFKGIEGVDLLEEALDNLAAEMGEEDGLNFFVSGILRADEIRKTIYNEDIPLSERISLCFERLSPSEQKEFMQYSINSGKLKTYSLSDMIPYLKDEDYMVQSLETWGSNLRQRSLTECLKKISNDEKKLALLDRFLAEETLGEWHIGDVLASISDFDERMKSIVNYYSKYPDFSVADGITKIANDDEKIKAVETYSSLIDQSDLPLVVASIKNDGRMIDTLYKYLGGMKESYVSTIFFSRPANRRERLFLELKDRMSQDVITTFISELDDAEEKIKYLVLADDVLDRGIQKYVATGLCSNFDKIDNLAGEQLYHKLEEVYALYENMSPSISTLGSLIGRQAKVNFAKERARDLQNLNYLPSDLAEKLSGVEYDDIVKLDSKFDGLNDSGLLKRAFNLVINSYSIEDVANLFRTLDGRDDEHVFNSNVMISDAIKTRLEETLERKLSSDECRIYQLLNKLNIGSTQIGSRKHISLVTTYIDEIKKVCDKQGISMSDLFSKVTSNNKNEVYTNRSTKFLSIFTAATERVFKESFKPKNKKDGALLTELATYCLNVEQRIKEEEERKEIESNIIRKLVLTEKGRELINRKRVEKIIKSDFELVSIFEDQSKRFPEKMSIIFAKMYPEYQYTGRETLDDLYKLMAKDDRFKNLLSQPIRDLEKATIPFRKDYLKIDNKMQKEKIIVSILNAINREDDELGNDELNPVIESRIDKIIRNIKVINDEAENLELFLFDELGLLGSSEMGSLLLYYDNIKTFKTVDGKMLNPDNLELYVDAAKKCAIRRSRYYNVLGDHVVDAVTAESVKKYYDHYIDNLSTRFYRTIPNVKGNFESNGKTLTYRSYASDEPEQLIAGVRMERSVKSSCFQLGHAQENTFKYITSSPNGTIVAVEDENGEFLGRVYGFRVGNTVNFTRFYYNKEFDFEEAMVGIAEDIIAKSKDIDYVTCIPYTSIDKEYTSKNLLPQYFDGGSVLSQENRSLYTDHPDRTISVVASRNPIEKLEDVKQIKGEITEKFYKERKTPEVIFPKELTSETITQSEGYAKACNVVCRSEQSKEFSNKLLAADSIIVGEDWVIISCDGMPLLLNINYGTSDEAMEYKKVVDEEVATVVDALQINGVITPDGYKEINHAETEKEPSVGGR